MEEKGDVVVSTNAEQGQFCLDDAKFNENIAYGEGAEILSARILTMEKVYAIGQHVTYLVSIVNTGKVQYADLTVESDLGMEINRCVAIYPLTYIEGTIKYFVNGVLQDSPLVPQQQPLTIKGITVPAGGNVTIIYSTFLNENAPHIRGTSVENTAVITGFGIEPITVGIEVLFEEVQKSNYPNMK